MEKHEQVSGRQKRELAIAEGTGPGSQLWNMLADDFGIDHKPNCPCLSTAERMNSLGPEGCKENRRELIRAIKEGKALYSWRETVFAAIKGTASGAIISYINPFDPLGSLIDEAVRRAEAAV
jgi:hypothetical protein